MKKWPIFVVFAVAMGAFAFWQRTLTKTEYINGLAAYRDLPNREYILERDCYIFKLAERNSAYPLIGANAPGAVCSVSQLPGEVSEKLVGTVAGGVRILDVARVGSRFKLVSVRRDTNRHGTTITYEILFTDEAARKYPRLDAYYLLDHSPEKAGGAPQFVDRFAVERVKR